MTCKMYYNAEKIRITYNEDFQQYWLFLGKNSHLLKIEEYQKIFETKGENLSEIFNRIDPTINMNLRQENIKLSSLEKAFNTIKKSK